MFTLTKAQPNFPAISAHGIARVIRIVPAAANDSRLTQGKGRKQDTDYLIKIADNIPGGRTICAFGEACAWPVQSFVGKFKDEFLARGEADEQHRRTSTQGAVPSSEMPCALDSAGTWKNPQSKDNP